MKPTQKVQWQDVEMGVRCAAGVLGDPWATELVMRQVEQAVLKRAHDEAEGRAKEAREACRSVESQLDQLPFDASHAKRLRLMVAAEAARKRRRRLELAEGAAFKRYTEALGRPWLP